MKCTLKALLLIGITVLFFVEVVANNHLALQVSLLDFEGEWVFEKAEMMENNLPARGTYQVKQRIDNVEDLDGLAGCFPYAVKRIHFANGIAVVDCPFASYCGRTTMTTVNFPKGDEILFVVGCDPNDLDKESAMPGLFFNTIGIEYWIEKIDDKTIALMKESVCLDSKGDMEHWAVRYILKNHNKD